MGNPPEYEKKRGSDPSFLLQVRILQAFALN